MSLPDPPITPVWDYVLLELRKRKHFSIFLPETAQDGAGTGIYVAAIGNQRLNEQGKVVTIDPPPFKIGDEVQASSEGMIKIQLPKQPLEEDGRRFLVCRPERIVCVINPDVFGPAQ